MKLLRIAETRENICLMRCFFREEFPWTVEHKRKTYFTKYSVVESSSFLLKARDRLLLLNIQDIVLPKYSR